MSEFSEEIEAEERMKAALHKIRDVAFQQIITELLKFPSDDDREAFIDQCRGKFCIHCGSVFTDKRDLCCCRRDD